MAYGPRYPIMVVTADKRDNLMQSLLIKQVDTLIGDELDERFSQIFGLEHKAWSSGAHNSELLDFALEHAVRVDLDRTTSKGGDSVDLVLTPRHTRVLFSELRSIYYQGLGVEFDRMEERMDDYLRFLKPIKTSAPTVAIALLRGLLTLAWRDVFYKS